MAGKSVNSFGAKNWSPGPPSTRYNVSGKNHDFYTFENAPGLGAYATGGTIIDGGDGYIYHIFTGAGTFQVNRPPAAIDSVDYLIAAGGGGSGPSAGGGAGGLLVGNISVSNAPGSYPIAIGGGGGTATNGSPSSAFGITATGGGRGSPPAPNNPLAGGPGGSGGGGFTGSPGSTSSGGTGDTPPTIPRQGYPGGTSGSQLFSVGGGGGAGGAGGFPNLPGPGKIIPQFPAPIVGKYISTSWISALDSNGFCKGAPHAAGIGTVNSGYGGGFSGIVCVRYKKTSAYSRATGGTIEPSTHPEHPGVWRHIFTSPGNFTVTDPTLQWIDYLAVGGGGAGYDIGPGWTSPVGGSGGGAGGFVSSVHTSTTTPTAIPEAYPWNPGYSVRVGEQMPVGVGTYPVVIGVGGSTNNANGSSTTIGTGASQIIAFGGGGGFTNPGRPGASGGGSWRPSNGTTTVAGAASPSPLIQGNPGGTAPTGPSPTTTAGGGGGAGAAGAAGGNGGVGWYSVLSPSAYGTPGPLTPTSIYRYFAGGGAGHNGSGGAGGGGPAGGGAGSGTPGTINTGGGGGGGTTGFGTGGPGIVIIQYPE